MASFNEPDRVKREGILTRILRFLGLNSSKKEIGNFLRTIYRRSKQLNPLNLVRWLFMISLMTKSLKF